MKILSLAICAVLAMCSQHGIEPQASDSPRNLEGFGLGGLLLGLSKQYHAPLGYEDVVVYREMHVVDVQISGTNLAEDIIRVIGNYPRYAALKVDSGDLFITQSGIPSTPGDIPVNYPGVSNATRKMFWESIYKLPEVNDWLQANGCQRRDDLSSKQWRGDMAVINIVRGVTTLRDLLDQAAIQSDKHLWQILRSQEVSGCIISMTLS